jgi:acyl-CoA synthetase (AMP-forming)/AMP-acid ligase II
LPDTTTPAHALPQVAEFLAAGERLTGPGSPFEVVTEDVRGETMEVFAHRPRSLRDVLVASLVHGERDNWVFGDGRRVTFADTERQVASVAAYLRDVHGVGPGDRVAVCGPNSAGWLVTFWACLSMGAVTVAMNGWWTEAEMHHALDLTEPKVLLLDAKRAERLGPTPGLTQVDLDTDLDTMLAHAPDATIPTVGIDEDDPAILIFTSGTTGRPKAAVLSHRSVIAYGMLQSFIGARALMLSGRAMPSGPPPVRLAVFPLFHVSGLGGTVSGIMTGSTTVWPLGRFEPEAVIELTVKEGINTWGGTGTHVIRLLEHPHIDRIDPAQLVQVGMGGSATTPEIIRRVDTKLPHLAGTMSTGYGSTETGSLVSYAPNWMLTASPECVGPPLPTVQVKITDPLGDELPDGEEGNICVRSPLLMNGYWRNPEADADAFLPGRWYITGDFGRMEGGLLYMATRRRDLIIRGGENIYPYEVENRLDEHPDVTEAAVIGIDHDVLGQEVGAVVVVRDGATVTADELRSFCAETLASYKVPVSIDIRTEALPRNPSGKILKHVLAGSGEHSFVEE